MRLIAASTLAHFAVEHPDAATALEHWRGMVRAAQWSSMQDVQAAAAKAKVLNGERVRFEIAGGAYRLIAAIDFRLGIVFVKFIGSHAEYDRIDALTVSKY